ncbi:hypothetical protein SLS62_002488 [Diatrype stigma]|uniref:DUF7053 domain-containing protein n=1 Tax=Diatrype stigma TaxID=117547 RepID=A0AAN9YV73_9PEZI
MSKRTVFTTVSPLPPDVSRDAVLAFLHDHEALIDLNPLVIERHPTAGPPPHLLPQHGGQRASSSGAAVPAAADDKEDDELEVEAKACAWWSLTDKIAYVPGEVTYAAAFYDLPDGVQTHVYAPLGTDIRERWSLGGTLPGEPPVPVEIGIGAPAQGLYIREDIDLRCNFLMTPFVKKTLTKAHGTLIDRLVERLRKDTAAAGGLNQNASIQNSSV